MCELLDARNGLHVFELVAKEASWKPKPTQAISEAIRCSPQTDGEVLKLMTTFTYLIKHREAKLVHT